MFLVTTVHSETVNYQSFKELLPPRNASRIDLFRSFVTPLWPYFVCNYYIGNELEHGAASLVNGIQLAVQLTSPSDAAAKLQAYDLLYVSVLHFEEFASLYLPIIEKNFFLMTGRMMLPQLYVSPSTHLVVESPKVAHWFMQNMKYRHEKVSPIPYGLHPKSLRDVLELMHDSNQNFKRGGARLLSMTETHPSRHQLIEICAQSSNCTHLQRLDYLKAIESAFFVISPIGDRPDCYRHWESIAFGAIPICNCPPIFDTMFQKNMIVAKDTVELLSYLNLSDDAIQRLYKPPDRSIVLSIYWENKITDIKKRFAVASEKSS